MKETHKLWYKEGERPTPMELLEWIDKTLAHIPKEPRKQARLCESPTENVFELIYEEETK